MKTIASKWNLSFTNDSLVCFTPLTLSFFPIYIEQLLLEVNLSLKLEYFSSIPIYEASLPFSSSL